MSIKQNKPSKSSRYKQGYYRVKNLEKYIGNPQQVIFRSGYELKFFGLLDSSYDVLKWDAEPEEMKIKYWNPIKNRYAHYYPDVYCEKLIDGKLKKLLIEIKPMSKTTKPRNNKGTTDRAYQRRLAEYLIIQNKAIAAGKYAAMKGMEYIFITEITIGKL